MIASPSQEMGTDDSVIRTIIAAVYVIIGVVVANGHHYFAHVTSFLRGLSAALAVLLWPLVLAGVSLHLH